MKNYLDALKRRKEETGESGFSLIELIVVVVILGVLAAIAIPIFVNLQADAAENAGNTVAANGASQAAAEIAKSATALTSIDLSNLNQDGFAVVASKGTDATFTLDNFCVTATKDTVPYTSGPGC